MLPFSFSQVILIFELVVISGYNNCANAHCSTFLASLSFLFLYLVLHGIIRNASTTSSYTDLAHHLDLADNSSVHCPHDLTSFCDTIFHWESNLLRFEDMLWRLLAVYLWNWELSKKMRVMFEEEDEKKPTTSGAKNVAVGALCGQRRRRIRS